MWNLFCNVVDNYGDAGVCWRLSRILSREHGVKVRLWIDDLGALQKLHPDIDAEAPSQQAEGVDVRLWSPGMSSQDTGAGEVVIEGFGCTLPQSFVEAMAQQASPPLWINLEYLSAEDWVSGCHRLPSPHPRLPLTKYFFFPGFNARTGGLLREADLFRVRDCFRATERAAYWQGLGLSPPLENEKRISLFAYENPVLPELLEAWAAGPQPLTVLVPEGRILPQLGAFFGVTRIGAGDSFERGRLNLRVLPFSDQDRYDRLLWACDLNFVRGEDSFLRAQWAGSPLVWHLYPQAEAAHEKKLDAFLDAYCGAMADPVAQAVRDFWQVWNGCKGGPNIGSAWSHLQSQHVLWQPMAEEWAKGLARGPELAAELVKFAQAHVKSRPFVD